jgi:hypothetical protein
LFVTDPINIHHGAPDSKRRWSPPKKISGKAASRPHPNAARLHHPKPTCYKTHYGRIMFRRIYKNKKKIKNITGRTFSRNFRRKPFNTNNLNKKIPSQPKEHPF